MASTGQGDASSAADAVKQGRAIRALMWLVYFVQKMGNHNEGVSKVPVSKALKTGGLDEQAAGHFMMMSNLGWTVKALLGPIVDNLPIFGYRRKGWLILGSVLSATAWLVASFFGDGSITTLLYTLIIVNLFVAMTDVTTDGMMVAKSRELEGLGVYPEGKASDALQATQWNGAYFAVAVSTVLGGIIAQFFSMKVAGVVSASMMLGLAGYVALAVAEERVAWDSEKAKRGFASLGVLALGVVLVLTIRHYAPPKAWFTPFLVPLTVIALTAAMVPVPKRVWLLLPILLLWNGSQFDQDAQAAYRYLTAQDHRLIDQVNGGHDAVVNGVLSILESAKVVTQEEIQTSGAQEVFFGTGMGLAFVIVLVAMSFLYPKITRGFTTKRKLVISVVSHAAIAVLFMLLSVFQISSTSYVLLIAALSGAASGFAILSVLSSIVPYVPTGAEASVYAFCAGMLNLGDMTGKLQIGGTVYSHKFTSIVPDAASATKEQVQLAADSAFTAFCTSRLVMLGILLVLLTWFFRRNWFGHETPREAGTQPVS